MVAAAQRDGSAAIPAPSAHRLFSLGEFLEGTWTMSTPQWFAEFERQEAMREERLDIIRADRQQRDLFAELREVTKPWTIHEDIRVSEQKRCREIGKKLHALGGEDLMRKAYYDAKGENPASITLAAYWDGIGEWRW
jgi:hypothetical protein